MAEHAVVDAGGLTHEREQLRAALSDVPVPPALDAGAEPAAEVLAARRSEGYR